VKEWSLLAVTRRGKVQYRKKALSVKGSPASNDSKGKSRNKVELWGWRSEGWLSDRAELRRQESKEKILVWRQDER